MEKPAIEHLMCSRVREAAERAAEACILEINAAGHDFRRDPDALFGWREETTGRRLSVTCALGVSVQTAEEMFRPPDPDVEAFIALAEAGTDREATLLNRLEGDVANGGFLQLYENQGLGVIREGIGLLGRLGARSTSRLFREALELFENREGTLKGYEDLRKELHRLDRRFNRLKENLPVLFLRMRRPMGT
ncbi:MAG: DUF4375 domain-containing protein [Acidobacteria bacterium]|nr:DUF4375 domain-containing protein [Acidobacteriota bacterium]